MAAKTNIDTSEIVDNLSRICGLSYISTEEEIFFAMGFSQSAKPEAIVYPGSPEEIQEIIRFAADSGTAVIPVGGGTLLGQVLTPSQQGIGICLSRLNRIEEFEPDNLSIICEAGTLHGAINNLVSSRNLQLPVLPDFDRATIGGGVATNFSSWKRYRFGAVGDYVLGLTFISPTGEVVRTGGKTVKNVSGYDFTKLLGSSWGTMGIISSVTLKLMPLPEQEIVLVRHFNRAEDALAESVKIMSVRPALSSCNLFVQKKDKNAESRITLSLSLEGSREFLESRLKVLQLTPEWDVANDAATLAAARESHLFSRRIMKDGFFHTAIIDKRELQRAVSAIRFLEKRHCLFDFDISAGVLEFSAPGYPRNPAEGFVAEWRNSTRGLQSLARDALLPDELNPLLGRILPTIDPQRIMFRNNIFSRRYNLG